MNSIKPIITSEIRQRASLTVKTVFKDGVPAVIITKYPFSKTDVLCRNPYWYRGHRTKIKNLLRGTSSTIRVNNSTFPMGRRCVGLYVDPDVPVQEISVLRKGTVDGKKRYLREFKQAQIKTEKEDSISREINWFASNGKSFKRFRELIHKTPKIEYIERFLYKFNPSNIINRVFGTTYELVVKEEGRLPVVSNYSKQYRIIPQNEVLPPDITYTKGL